jgi:iron complex transport system substrate-binding protein
MKRAVFILILSILLLSACARPTPTIAPAPTLGPSFILTDALGREVSFQSPPQRIVLAGRALFMIADALYMFPEAPERIAALGDTSQGAGNFISLIDPNYAAKDTLGSEAGAEQIAAAQPDVVILKSYLAQSLGKSVETLGVPVVYVDFETPEQYPRDIAILGTLFQDDARAQTVADFYRSKMNQISEKVSGLIDVQKPRTLLIYYNNLDGNIAFNVPPLDWIQTKMVEMAGGVPVWADANPVGSWSKITLEQIATWDPDTILVVAYTSDPGEAVAGLKADPQWQSLRAVQEDRLYAFPGDSYSWDQPDPRWILGLTWVAGKLHPDLFTGLDMVSEAQTFYSQLYGLDQAFFQTSIRPTFKGDLP